MTKKSGRGPGSRRAGREQGTAGPGTRLHEDALGFLNTRKSHVKSQSQHPHRWHPRPVCSRIRAVTQSSAMPGEGTPHGDEAWLSPVLTQKGAAGRERWTLDAESRALHPRLLSLTQTAGSVFRTDPSARVKDVDLTDGALSTELTTDGQAASGKSAKSSKLHKHQQGDRQEPPPGHSTSRRLAAAREAASRQEEARETDSRVSSGTMPAEVAVRRARRRSASGGEVETAQDKRKETICPSRPAQRETLRRPSRLRERALVCTRNPHT